MIDWPSTLINEIAKGRCVLFLGAGVSATASNPAGNRPPDWKTFLSAACSLVKDPTKRAAVDALISEGKLLVALQAIKDLSDQADYHAFLDSHFNSPHFEPSELHRIINALDARIVITTNFDKIYERYCFSAPGGMDAFKIIDYRAAILADELRSDTRLIVKAHGTIDKIEEMIFTKAQYHEAKRDYPRFYDVLRAIFLTNTIVFIGCGLEDPDILLLLEDVRISGRQSKPHYALIKQGKHEFMIRDWRATYNIAVIEYGPDHDDLKGELQNLLDQVESARADLTGAIPAGV
ncbi:hypothetical protein SB18R_24100 [Pseudomonas oryzihabitans]|nr:hypothetical protein SB18R_24100 [Pseudomonas psychrotolerans]